MSISAVPSSSDRLTTSPVTKTAFSILMALSCCHLLNDLVQSLLPSIYPLLKTSFKLSFSQIGLITLTFQCTASLLQPLIGHYTDKHPAPYSLVIGMALTLIGLFVIAYAPTYPILLVGAAVIGTGSAVFHPESSRMARFASGGQHGLAQSLFQVGGNTGSSIGPLVAAFVIMRYGQHSLSWFTPLAIMGMIILAIVAHWYATRRTKSLGEPTQTAATVLLPIQPRSTVVSAITILMLLVFSKYFYLASITSYYMFYLMHKFHVSAQSAQIHLFVFLAAVALGTFVGGPVGDRIGRKYVIWASILGVLPFTLALPYASLSWTGILTVIIGFILASAFSAIIVFAQELLPNRIGLISGLFFGFAFGVAGIGAGVLGVLADRFGITAVYHLCSYLPAIGLLAAFLPNIKKTKNSQLIRASSLMVRGSTPFSLCINY